MKPNAEIHVQNEGMIKCFITNDWEVANGKPPLIYDQGNLICVPLHRIITIKFFRSDDDNSIAAFFGASK